MEAELQRQIEDLRAANESLLDSHGKLSIAYLAMRVSRVEDLDREFRQSLSELEQALSRLQADVRRDLDRLSQRLDGASKAFVSLRDRLDGDGSGEK